MGSNGLTLMVLQIAAILAVMYFLFVRPQSQARKRSEAMLAALRKGDDIMTAGGIVGKVRDIKESLITIESGSATFIVERSRIVRVGNQTAAATPAA
ncbi:MAG: preprotein translocase subunit YajC [Gemmatimonadales bacterium]